LELVVLPRLVVQVVKVAVLRFTILYLQRSAAAVAVLIELQMPHLGVAVVEQFFPVAVTVNRAVPEHRVKVLQVEVPLQTTMLVQVVAAQVVLAETQQIVRALGALVFLLLAALMRLAVLAVKVVVSG
jgi:hypothetical protein